MTFPNLVLASSSPYRKALLERLGVAFECASPDIDESAKPREDGPALAQRLADQKSRALAARYKNHWIIGSDQVATLEDGTILGKPGSIERAQEQLAACSGRSVIFYTGLSLFDSVNQRQQLETDTFRVHFRHLSMEQIHAYLQKEQPLDAAGSFYMEGLGIALFKSLEGRDPNSLIGLPLISLIDMWEGWGFSLLGPQADQ